jgi:hypothetical protein
MSTYASTLNACLQSTHFHPKAPIPKHYPGSALVSKKLLEPDRIAITACISTLLQNGLKSVGKKTRQLLNLETVKLEWLTYAAVV